MTEERSKTDAGGVTDSLVTQTYRDSATETAPASLNETVLRQAKAGGGRGYSRSILWLRPMAWAATIGLCLAIVVELSGVPQPEPGMFEVPESRSVTGAPQAEDELAAEMPALEQDAPVGDSRSQIYEESPASPVSDAGEDVQKILRDQEGRSESKIEPFQASPARDIVAEGRIAESVAAEAAGDAVSAPAETDTADPGAFRVDDAPILERAENEARLREGQDEGARQLAVPSSAVMPAAALEADAVATEAPCDDDTIATPETWFACIEELETAGLADVAREQRVLLQDAFPEFEPPSE